MASIPKDKQPPDRGSKIQQRSIPEKKQDDSSSSTVTTGRSATRKTSDTRKMEPKRKIPQMNLIQRTPKCRQSDQSIGCSEQSDDHNKELMDKEEEIKKHIEGTLNIELRSADKISEMSKSKSTTLEDRRPLVPKVVHHSDIYNCRHCEYDKPHNVTNLTSPETERFGAHEISSSYTITHGYATHVKAKALTESKHQVKRGMTKRRITEKHLELPKAPCQKNFKLPKAPRSTSLTNKENRRTENIPSKEIRQIPDTFHRTSDLLSADEEPKKQSKEGYIELPNSREGKNEPGIEDGNYRDLMAHKESQRSMDADSKPDRKMWLKYTSETIKPAEKTQKWSNTECKAVPPPIQSAKQTSPLEDYPSRLHVQERLNEIQLEVEEEARQVIMAQMRSGKPYQGGSKRGRCAADQPTGQGRQGPLKILKDRIPELGELLEDAKEGDLEYLMTATKTYTSRGSNEESNKMIYLLLHDEDESVVDEGPRLYELLTKLRDATISEVEPCIPRNPRGRTITHWKAAPIAGNEIEEETITVTAAGKSYAELLKTVKHEVDIKHLGVKIAGIKKMRGEAIQLTVEGDKDKANILVKIRKNVVDAEAKVKTSDITIAISGIDIATTDEEVIEALASATGEKEENVQLRSLRPGYYDDQTAVVEMPRTPALTMLKQGRLRVGWISCPVRERIHLRDATDAWILDTNHRNAQEKIGQGQRTTWPFAIAVEKNVDLLIVSEPNKKLIESQAWLKDERGDVAALFLNKSVEVTIVRRKRAFLCKHMSHCCMIMTYISPNTGLDNYKRQLDEAFEYGRQCRGNSAWWVT
ncbi:hypothetical protein JTB14_032041 [Gonioctena quinquepunctata]|nr:hypothetical protein JTB14_032041 [Gonioctena quinquepunctata]